MRQDERGFVGIEVLAALVLTALVAGAAVATAFQLLPGVERNSSYMTAVRQVQNAGCWISRDAEAAENVTIGSTASDFLVLSWTERNYNMGDSTYHSITYSLVDLVDGIGKLKRYHWSSAGTSEQSMVASYIYYDPGDAANTTKASYQTPLLTVQLTAISEGASESREYKVERRPNF